MRLAFAIHDLVYSHSNPTVAFYMTLDVILVSLEGPYGIRLHAVAHGASFDSAPERDLPIETELFNLGSADPHGPVLMIELRTVRRRNESERDAIARMDAQLEVVRSAFNLLVTMRAPLRDEPPFLDFLITGLKLASDFVASSDHASEGSEKFLSTNRATAKKTLEIMFAEIEQNLGASDHNINFFDYKGSSGLEIPPSRIAFCHRYLDDEKESYWRVQALTSQVSWRRTIKGRARSMLRPGKVLERIFRNDLQLVCDAGIASWIDGSESRQFEGADSIWRAVVLPIHVQGVPWFAVMGLFTPGEEIPKSFRINEWAISVYLQLFPQIISAARQLADRYYSRQVTGRIFQALLKGQNSPEAVEAALEPLLAIFPHGRVRFGQGEIRENEERRISELPIFVTPNHGMRGGSEAVSYSMMPTEWIRDAIRRAEDRYQTAQGQRELGEAGAYFSISHTMKNLIETTGWVRASNAIGPIAKQLRELPRDEHEIQSDDIREAVDLVDRALALSPMISGLAYVGQLFGAYTKKLDRKKFEPWLPEDREIPAKLELEPYAVAVQQIVAGICFGRRWDEFKVSWARPGESPILLASDKKGPLRPKRLVLPPFKQRSDAVYPFFFALFEPIQNALKALNEVKRNGRLRKTPDLRVHLTQAEDDPELLLVEISNLSLEPVNETSVSGLDDVNALLGRMDWVKFEMSPSVPHGELHDVKVSVQMKPLALARFIRYGRERNDDSTDATQSPNAPDR